MHSITFIKRLLSFVHSLRCSKKIKYEDFNFAIGLGSFVLNLPDGQMKFFEEFKLQKNCKINSAHRNVFGAS